MCRTEKARAKGERNRGKRTRPGLSWCWLLQGEIEGQALGEAGGGSRTWQITASFLCRKSKATSERGFLWGTKTGKRFKICTMNSPKSKRWGKFCGSLTLQRPLAPPGYSVSAGTQSRAHACLVTQSDSFSTLQFLPSISKHCFSAQS